MLSAVGLIYYMPTVTPGQQPQFYWQFVVIGVVTVILYQWIAVAWHRYVLLDERPHTVLPIFRADRILAYFGRGLQAGLILALVGALLGLITGILAAATHGALFVILGSVIVLLSVILLLAYRLAPMFPGAALSRSLGVKEAWAATSGASGSIFGLAIISAIVSIIIDLPAQVLPLLPSGNLWAILWVSITGWVKLMVGLSIFTTLYGVYVEKRAVLE